MGERTDMKASALRCVECGLVSSGRDKGWEAHLTIDNEIGLYCPECAEREFGT